MMDSFDVMLESAISTAVIFSGLWGVINDHVRKKVIGSLPVSVLELRVMVEALQSENEKLKKELAKAQAKALPPPDYEVVKLNELIHIKCTRCESETRIHWKKVYQSEDRNNCVECPICKLPLFLSQCRVTKESQQ
jgi:hypothetical protein